jgi:hypothetical protein
MTPTQKLQQIKNWLFSFEKNHKFARYKGEDNTEYEIDGDLSIGKEVYKVMEDGKTEMAADGKIQIDGKVLEVVKGVIKNIISGNKVIDRMPYQNINEENKKTEMSENQKFAVSDSLNDGTQVSVSGDKIQPGADLRIVVDGEEKLPPAGEHELKSGVVVVVDEAGKILEVKPVEAKPEIDVEVEAAEAKPMEEKKDTGVENIKEMMKQIMEAVEEMKQKMSEMQNKQTTMGEEFATFKKEPAAEPIKRNEKADAYLFGSGDNARVQMIEAFRTHIKNK